MTYYTIKKTNYLRPKSDKISFVGPYMGSGRYCNATTHESIDAAQEALEELNSGIYVTSHEESSRPEYQIVDEDGAFDFNVVQGHDDMSGPQYDWTHCANPDAATDDEIIAACDALEFHAWNGLRDLQ